jgi:hypothetical protein
MEKKPLSWQKLRHILDAAGVLKFGWKIGAKRGTDMIAVVWYPGDKSPGKRRVDKLTRALDAAGITYREETTGNCSRFGIPREGQPFSAIP